MSGMPASIGQNGHVAAAEHIRYRQFDDELVVLDLGAGEYFALNGTGARMWHGLVSGKSPAEVAVDLATQYDVEAHVLLHDCVSLTDDLLERRLLERRSS